MLLSIPLSTVGEEFFSSGGVRLCDEPRTAAMRLFTIGFTQKSAQQFFALLRQPGLRRVIDVRLNNTSQLAGFAKQDDLRFFLRELLDLEYVHLPLLAPTQTMLDAYRKLGGSWERYAADFAALLQERRIEEALQRELLDGACLLCSEAKPQQCHRLLVAEYLNEKWGGIEIRHL